MQNIMSAIIKNNHIIDIKNRKILYELDRNSRSSSSQIGKKVGLNKSVVEYRINRLKKRGIIFRFVTVINPFKLGYNCFRIYLKFKHTSPEIEKNIINHFVDNETTFWVATIEGRYDLSVIIWVKYLSEFYMFWKNTLKKYRIYFDKQIVSIYYQLSSYPYYFLIQNNRIDEKAEYVIGSDKPTIIENLEFRLLQLLASNSRIPITSIARQLNTTTTIVNYRIKKLIKMGIINGFRIAINHLKLGYNYFKIDINLDEYQKIDHIINYIKPHPNLFYIDTTVGFSDLELSFYLNNTGQLHEIMGDIIEEFPNCIRNYEHFRFIWGYKVRYFPALHE